MEGGGQIKVSGKVCEAQKGARPLKITYCEINSGSNFVQDL